MDTSDLESKLRSELASSAEEPVPGGLFAAAQRRARRRAHRRRALAATLGVVLLGGAAAGALLQGGSGPTDDVATGPPGADTDPAAEPPVDGAGIVLAVKPNGPGFAVVDLDGGTVRDYPPGSHTLPGGAVSGVAVTARGDAVVWQYDGVVRVVPGADFPQPSREITPATVRSRPGYATTFWVVPSPDGSQLWIVQPPLEGMTSSLVDLVDVDTGANLAAIEVDVRAMPVAATEDSLIVNTGTPDAGGQRVVLLDVNGTTHDVATGGRGIASFGDTVAMVDPSGANLTLVDIHDGRELAVDAPTPGIWTTVGEGIIPGESGPLPVVSPDGELLVRRGTGSLDTGDYVSTLYAVSMVDGTTRALSEFEGPPPAVVAWSADGEHVVAAENTGLPEDDRYIITTSDPDATEAEATVVAELDPGYFPLAAG
ncbi:MAG TPA: hypothetical protein VK964_04270 [Nocardioidaceae bacterium]|nr:hypothetical protein [Nocardioidaceae bacterium]